MGCTNSFLYNSTAFKDLLYTEKIDKRLGKIYLMRSAAINTAYIAKEIPAEKFDFYEKKILQMKATLGVNARLFLLPLGVSDMLNVLKSEQFIQKKQKNHCYLKLEFFQRDFTDEFNVKSLKQKKFHGFEVWSLIYTIIFVYAVLEENAMPINRLTLENLLISNNSYKYYSSHVFDEFAVGGSFEHSSDSFEQHKAEILLTIFEMLKTSREGEMPEFNAKIHDSKYFNNEYNALKGEMDEDLKFFVYNVMINNSLGFQNFVGLRGYLVTIYEDMEYEVIDEVIVKEYKL